MARDIFQHAVERALEELPPEFQRHMENVEVLIEGEHPDEPGLYGLYEGIPLPQRTVASLDFQAPDRVYVFRRPLTQDFGHDPRLLAHEVRVTVLHELAHHFGIDELRLDELGWA